MHTPAAWVRENVRPTIVMLALRGVGLGFTSTVKSIVVGPVPPAGIPVTHAGTPLVVHPQPDPVFTLNALAPPAAVAPWRVGLKE